MDRLYYVEYSRKLVTGKRLQLCAVWSMENLAWYLLNYSERYDYIIDSTRIATPDEIERFTPKCDDEAYP